MTVSPVITTPRLVLRTPVEADWPAVSDSMRSSLPRFTGGPTASEFDRWRGFLASIGHWTLRGYGFFMVLKGDMPVGRVGLIYHSMWREPELGWNLFDGHEGQGYATEAALAVRGWAYETLGMGALISQIHPENTGSIRVAERLGATRESEGELLGEPCLVYRHPAPDADGSPEAYA